MACPLADETIKKFLGVKIFSIIEIRGGISKQVYQITADKERVMLYIWLCPMAYPLTENKTAGADYLFAEGFRYFIHNTEFLSGLGIKVPQIISYGHQDDGNFDFAFVEYFEGRSFQELMDSGETITQHITQLTEVMQTLSNEKRNYYGSLLDQQPLGISAEQLAYNFYAEELNMAAAFDLELANARPSLLEMLRGKLKNITAPQNRKFSLIHGELTPPHIFVFHNGRIGLIDIEAIKYYDREYDWAVLNDMYGDKILLPEDLNFGLLDFYKTCLQIGYVSVAADYLAHEDKKNSFFRGVRDSNLANLMKECCETGRSKAMPSI